MGEIVKRVVLPEDVINNIQRIYYEYIGYKDLINSMVRSDYGFEYNQEIYERLIKEFHMSSAQYHLTISELESIYAPEFSDLRIKSYFNFKNNVLTIEKVGD